MKDLTRGSIGRHVVSMAAPVAAGMIFQTMYFFVDLYFVSRLGDAAIAGVSAAGNISILITALTQVLGIGSVSVISHAVGRKDRAEANVVFHQSLLLAAMLALATLVAGYAASDAYVRAIAADEATTRLGALYLYWFAPGLALQFPLTAMASALRGTGIVQPTMVVQVTSVLLNALLAPMFIAGWGTHHPMGVAGAGLATSVAVAVSVLLLSFYFARLETYVGFRGFDWRPRLAPFRRILTIGLPAGGEFALLFIYTGTSYWAIRSCGAAAQAGFGIGSRVMQGIFVPALAIAFAAAPIAGQNFGAGNPQRVRETFQKTAAIGMGAMLLLMVACQWNPAILVRLFTHNAEVLRVGAMFLHIVSWNFIAQGLIFTCSNMFQGLGYTLPSLVSSGTRLVTYVGPAIWLSTQSFFRIELLWYWSIATVFLQAIVSVLLLRRQLRIRLAPLEAATRTPRTSLSSAGTS